MDCSETFCVVFSNPKKSILLSNFSYIFWMKSYLYVNTDVQISCSDWNNLGIINCIKLLTSKSKSMGKKSLQTKFQLPHHKDERKHSFLVTLAGGEKQLSLGTNILVTLTATVNKH